MPLAILQARSSSSRMPGKVLKPILGIPMILRAIERIQHSETLDGLVLATSVEASDDLLAETVSNAGVVVRRGSLDDVLARFMDVIEEFQPSDVVRLTGDNPLVDPRVIDFVVRAHLESNSDYTSNATERTFPRGLDVEVVRVDALRLIDQLGLTQVEREHVTIGIYGRPDRFTLHAATQSPSRSELRWTVDYPADFDFVSDVYEELYEANPRFGQAEILDLLERRPDLRRLERDVTG